KRAGFVPRKVEDFGDGGAFPEIHVAQYPFDMGREKSLKPGSKILPVSVDAHGNVAYDAIVRQNENSKKIVYTQQKDLIPKILKNDEDDEMVDDEDVQEEIEQTMQETKAALEKIVNFLTEVKKGKKAMEKVGGGGTMRASAGSSMRDSHDGGSGRTRIGFERGH
ncbi:hypothetical protein TanjilG_29732, partial [Lupinus angustifolius]